MHRLVLDDGQVVTGRTVLIATGGRLLRTPGRRVRRWDGAGIFYSCTSVHARSCKDGRAAVVGGGNSAGQAAMFLADHTAGATFVLQRGQPAQEHVGLSRLAGSSNTRGSISCVTSRWTPSGATTRSRGMRLRDVRDGGTRELDCPAVFVFIRAQPNRMVAPGHRRRWRAL